MRQHLERAVEQSVLDALIDASARGQGGAVVIEGPAGIGKSSLIDHVRLRAKDQGFGRLRGSGDPADGALPWGVVRQLVELSISRYAGEVRDRIIEGPAGRALRALDGAPDSRVTDEAAFARTLHALWWVAADLSSTRPLLITVDDAQWADLPSQRFLSYLARRLADLPVALVIGSRPPSDRNGPLAELMSGRLAQRLTPQPLSADGLTALAGHRGQNPAQGVVSALRTATGGNPLLSEQLLDELVHRGLDLGADSTASLLPQLGPHTVSRSLLADLSPPATAIASALAVLGRRGDLAAAADLARVDQGDAQAAVDELVAAHVLEGGRRDLAFVHPVIREAVLGTLRTSERADLHARAAQQLQAHCAPPEQVAAHLVMSPLHSIPGTVGVLRAAAASLLSRGDAQTAAAHLARALETTPEDMDLRAELGAALLRAGDPVSARPHLLAGAAAPCLPHVRAERLLDAATATSRTHGPEAGAVELERVLRDPDLDDRQARLMLEAGLASLSTLTSSGLERSGRRLTQFEGLAGDTQAERTLLALLSQRAFYAVRPAADVVELATRALAGGRFFDDMGADVIPWGNAMHALVLADGTDAALIEIAQARRSLSADGSPMEFALVATAAAMTATRTGDVQVADTESATALASLALIEPEARVAGLVAVCTQFAVKAALDRGEVATATRLLHDFDGAWPGQSGLMPVQRLALARGALALTKDAPQVALSLALELGITESTAGLENPAIAWRILAARAALRLGDLTHADQLSSEQLARAHAWGAASDIGAALRVRARVIPQSRLPLLQQAVEVLEESPARLELAAALTDLGEALGVVQQRTDARNHLRRGAELADAQGALAVRGRALEGLGALGDRPRKLMFSGAESLTGSERRVAELAAEGHSNREIAQELFVTPKTVENHLGRVYVKLAITGRKELVSALAPA